MSARGNAWRRKLADERQVRDRAAARARAALAPLGQTTRRTTRYAVRRADGLYLTVTGPGDTWGEFDVDNTWLNADPGEATHAAHVLDATPVTVEITISTVAKEAP